MTNRIIEFQKLLNEQANAARQIREALTAKQGNMDLAVSLKLDTRLSPPDGAVNQDLLLPYIARQAPCAHLSLLIDEMREYFVPLTVPLNQANFDKAYSLSVHTPSLLLYSPIRDREVNDLTLKGIQRRIEPHLEENQWYLIGSDGTESTKPLLWVSNQEPEFKAFWLGFSVDYCIGLNCKEAVVSPWRE